MKLTKNKLRRLIAETIREMSHKNPGMSARERYELEHVSDDPYYLSDPELPEEPVLSPEEEEARRQAKEREAMDLARARARYRRIFGDYGDISDY